MERGVERVEQGAARHVDAAHTVAAGDASLRRQDDLRPRNDRAQKGSEQPLAVAIGVAGRRVDEGAAGFNEGGELVTGLVLVGVAAPRHGAEPDP